MDSTYDDNVARAVRAESDRIILASDSEDDSKSSCVTNSDRLCYCKFKICEIIHLLRDKKFFAPAVEKILCSNCDKIQDDYGFSACLRDLSQALQVVRPSSRRTKQDYEDSAYGNHVARDLNPIKDGSDRIVTELQKCRIATEDDSESSLKTSLLYDKRKLSEIICLLRINKFLAPAVEELLHRNCDKIQDRYGFSACLRDLSRGLHIPAKPSSRRTKQDYEDKEDRFFKDYSAGKWHRG